MIAYAKQAKEAERTASALRFQCRELELDIEDLDEQYKIERAAWIVAHASLFGADVEKSITSSSVVAMKRNALEAQILAQYPFSFYVDLPAKKLELAAKEMQYKDARADVTSHKMMFLAALRGFSDMDEKPYDPQAFIDDDDLLIQDEINRKFELATNEEDYV